MNGEERRQWSQWQECSIIKLSNPLLHPYLFSFFQVPAEDVQRHFRATQRHLEGKVKALQGLLQKLQSSKPSAAAAKKELRRIHERLQAVQKEV